MIVRVQRHSTCIHRKHDLLHVELNSFLWYYLDQPPNSHLSFFYRYVHISNLRFSLSHPVPPFMYNFVLYNSGKLLNTFSFLHVVGVHTTTINPRNDLNRFRWCLCFGRLFGDNWIYRSLANESGRPLQGAASRNLACIRDTSYKWTAESALSSHRRHKICGLV